MNFANNLSLLRRRAGYTQEGLAEAMNVSRQAMSKWERGQTLPEAAALPRLADLLGCTLDQLMREELAPEAPPRRKSGPDTDRRCTMVLSFEEVGALLDEMAEAFPKEFYAELNGGILLLPEMKRDPEFPDEELLIMGEFCCDQMGRYINLYYGSFAALAGEQDWAAEDWKDELWETLAHEFTHHIEGLAGERGLEIKDEEFMEKFRRDKE